MATGKPDILKAVEAYNKKRNAELHIERLKRAGQPPTEKQAAAIRKAREKARPLTEKQKRDYAKTKAKRLKDWGRQRYAYVLWSKFGLTLKEVGEKLGVSGSQAQVLANKGKDLQTRHPHHPAKSDVYADFKKLYDEVMNEK